MFDIKDTTKQEVKNNHDQISFTAYLVADWRAGYIPYADKIAEALNARKLTGLVLGEELRERMSWFGSTMIEARHKTLRKTLEGSKNIYALAEGALPTALNLGPEVKYLHTDLPGMLSDAEAVLKDIMITEGLKRPNLRFLPVNALDFKQVQDGAYYFNGEQFDFSCEGLVMYLPPLERKLLFPIIREVLVNNNGATWKTPDFNYKSARKIMFDELGEDYMKNLGKCLEIIEEKTEGRNILGNFFENPEQARDETSDAGLEIVKETPFYDGTQDYLSLRNVPTEFQGRNLQEGIKRVFMKRYVTEIRPKK